MGLNSTYICWSLIYNCFQEPFSSICVENITWETMSLSAVLAVVQLKCVIWVFGGRYEKCHKCLWVVSHRPRAAPAKWPVPLGPQMGSCCPSATATPPQGSGNCPHWAMDEPAQSHLTCRATSAPVNCGGKV